MFITAAPVTTITHQVVTRTPDYLDLLTVFLPVLTFIAGYYLNSLVENRKERNRLRHTEKYFYALAAALVSAIDVQVEAIAEGIHRIQAVASDNLAVSIVSELRATRLKAIPDLDLYKIFVANRRNVEENTNYLIAISTAFDFIDDIKSRIEQINLDTAQELNKYIDDYNEGSSVLAEENKRMFKEVKTLDIEFKKLNAIAVNLANQYAKKAMGRDIAAGFNNYILPLYNATREIQNTADTNRMLYAIVKMNGDYNNFANTMHLAGMLLEGVVVQLRNIEAELRHVIKHLKNNPMKF